MLPLLNIPMIWFFLPSISLFFLLPYFSEHYLFTLFHFASLCQFSPCGSPLCPLHLDLLFSLPPTHSPVSLSMPLFLVTFVFPLHHLTPFIPRCLSHPFISLLFFSSPSLFPVSVEPLWLHRYSDCWLCCRGGMLFRHSIRRYCTTCTLPLTIKTTAHNIPLLFIHCTMFQLKCISSENYPCFLFESEFYWDPSTLGWQLVRQTRHFWRSTFIFRLN